ncbi:MAG: TspO/MBR family protein [Polyangiaceae bacterium]
MDIDTRARQRPLLALFGFAAVTALTAVIGAKATIRGKEPWYRLIRKSRLNPPDWVFGPVWTTLFALSAVSGYRVWRTPPSPARTRALTLWTAQLALNANWSRLFFGQHRPKAAFVDLGALLTSVGGYMQQAQQVDKPAAYLMAPYLGWVRFAGYLNKEVVRKNPSFLTA